MTDDWRNIHEMADELGRVRGWAPGSYFGKCSGCKRQFIGDKRARECLPCAVAGLEKRARDFYQALKTINRLNDHPGYFNKAVQDVLDAVIDTRDIVWGKCGCCDKDVAMCRGDIFCADCPKLPDEAE